MVADEEGEGRHRRLAAGNLKKLSMHGRASARHVHSQGDSVRHSELRDSIGNDATQLVVNDDHGRQNACHESAWDVKRCFSACSARIGNDVSQLLANVVCSRWSVFLESA